MNTSNSLKTAVLLAGLTGLMVFVGRVLGGQQGMIIAFVLALGMNGFAYWFSDRFVLMTSGAKPLEPGQAPELHLMVERLAREAGLPMPRLYLMDDPSPNAFATGRNPQNGVVAVTTGLLAILDRDEVEGVLAHELSHIKHRDILVSTIAATIAGAIGMLAQMAQYAAIFGGLGRGDDEEEGGGAAGLVGALAMAFVAPIIAMFLQMAVSRSREYMADAGAAALTRRPGALANALLKLERGAHAMPMHANPGTAPLYIVHPFAGGLGSLLSTHPPIPERVARLQALAEEWGQRGMRS